jgi:hypothetical protein
MKLPAMLRTLPPGSSNCRLVCFNNRGYYFLTQIAVAYPCCIKTRGIVLKTTDYGESSVIVQVFTEKLGLQSYIINGVKKAKGQK